MRTQNRALGSFQPFKTFNISQKQMAERLRIQTDLEKKSKELNKLRRQLAEFQDQLASISTGPAELQATGNKTDIGNLDKQRTEVASSLSKIIQDIRDKIRKGTAQFNSNLSSGEKSGLRIYGNDIWPTFEKTTGASSGEETAESEKRTKLRNKMLQLRPQLGCKFNTDTNLFIVSDDYDKDLDIQAFVLKSLSNSVPLWESSYDTPINTCINVAKTLDFEFFCDTQGHIHFRPPKYNKMPLSCY